MRKCLFILLFSISIVSWSAPWDHGALMISDEGRYLKHSDGTPFFWLGDTGWLLPQRTDRNEAEHYLNACQKAGFNVVLVQVLNGVPSINAYGASSNPEGFDFSVFEHDASYHYWAHMDYLVETAEKRGIYIGMVCIWGGLVKSGKMNVDEAGRYGTFLAQRYRNRPNILWIIGGDVPGDVKPDVWNALAQQIKKLDPNHLMTYHPKGRTSSIDWFEAAEWKDFDLFQSGHRRYGQRMGDAQYPIEDNTEEDNWRYVQRAYQAEKPRPILDGEPSYEQIPQGLHDPSQPRWTDADARRYAYWSVFAGACGHTYGHNSIMQFYRPGYSPAYAAEQPWYEALQSGGFAQMQHLKSLMLKFPYFERVPAQSLVVDNGVQYNRLVATAGKQYCMVYSYTGESFVLDLSRFKEQELEAFWYAPYDGQWEDIGHVKADLQRFTPPAKPDGQQDRVLVVVNTEKLPFKKQ
ncbi:MAG: glycoside hydrolase family 140 protein [Bacteroidales bacterium]